MGAYTEEGGVTGLVTTAYRMTSGENYISAFPEAEECRDGAKINDCTLDRISVFVSNAMSIALDGNELSGLMLANAEEVLGTSGRVEERDGITGYKYTFPERGIDQMQLTFPHVTERVQQIIVVFANDF